MKKKIYAALAFALYATTFHAQQIYELSAPAKEKTIYTGHLKMGGSNPSGGNISVNSYYMSIDGKPVIPVMGEFHFTRYPRAQWEQEIVKMKAGGVNVLPTYIFWGLHEEEEGKFCWSGNKDLRHFIELCKKHDMPVIVSALSVTVKYVTAPYPTGFSPVRWMYAAISLYTSLM